LATERRVSASTQRQALNVLVFLYKHVLDIQLEAARDGERFCPSISESSETARALGCQNHGNLYLRYGSRHPPRLKNPPDVLFAPQVVCNGMEKARGNKFILFPRGSFAVIWRGRAPGGRRQCL
jgi:hypothetical protein